jgi:L-2-hydroxyglutarate oxidase LhgO
VNFSVGPHMSVDVQTVVIGAGVVGLAIARALARSGHEVLVLERHDRIGSETSSRSSEVIHAGLYYPPGSLKAELCVRGRAMLYEFARENGVPVQRYGKLLVATREDETPALEAIARRAVENGVTDLELLDEAAARAMEPELSCVAAYFSPSTGVIDSSALMLALEGHIRTNGGDVVLNTSVVEVSRNATEDFVVTIESEDGASSLVARNLVLAAGHGGTMLGRMLKVSSGYAVPTTHLAKGHYFALSGRAPFKHLIYPMPHGGGLGVHLTLDVAGQAKFGPDIDWCVEGSELSYAFDDASGARLASFEHEIRRYWPGLPRNALAPAYTGIRPKINRQGEPPADFAIHGEAQHGISRLVALYGIESPGLTSSLAIGDYVSALFT